MERIPILKLGELLLVSIQVDMYDRLALVLQDDLAKTIVRHRSRGVLIDISSLEIVDSFIGRVLGNIASVSRVLDAETVVVGMQPAVAITLVELGMSLPGIRTALNVERGMELLRAATEPMNGGSLNGGSLNGGSLNGGSLNGGSMNGGSMNGGSMNGGSVADAALVPAEGNDGAGRKE